MSRTLSKKSAHGRIGNLPVPVRRRVPRIAPIPRTHGLKAGELVKLHHSLAESHAHTKPAWSASLSPPESGAGTEDVGYDLAYISAAWLGKRVLFVNGTQRRMRTCRSAMAPVAGRRCSAMTMRSTMWKTALPG